MLRGTQAFLKLIGEASGLDVSGGEEYGTDGRAFPTVLATQRGGHPIMLQFLLQLLAPGSILRVIADKSKIFELLFHVIALSFFL